MLRIEFEPQPSLRVITLIKVELIPAMYVQWCTIKLALDVDPLSQLHALILRIWKA